MFYEKYDGINVASKTYNYQNVSPSKLMKLLKNGPVVVLVAAYDWDTYKRGIL